MVYEIYAGAAAGTITRIVLQNGYDGLPQFYTSVDGKTTFQLNVLGVFLMGILTSILGVFVAMQTGALQFTSFGAAFAATYIGSNVIDNVLTKLKPNVEVSTDEPKTGIAEEEDTQ
jgi:fluoride ion exporter CrcB/FEX